MGSNRCREEYFSRTLRKNRAAVQKQAAERKSRIRGIITIISVLCLMLMMIIGSRAGQQEKESQKSELYKEEWLEAVKQEITIQDSPTVQESVNLPLPIQFRKVWPNARKLLEEYAIEGQQITISSLTTTEKEIWFLCVLKDESREIEELYFHVWASIGGDEQMQIETDLESHLLTYWLYYHDNNEILDIYVPEWKSTEHNHDFYSTLEELFREPIIISTKADMEEVEEVFQKAYNSMYLWQEEITADLSQDIRFGITSDNWHVLAWSDEENIEVYRQWLMVYGNYFPTHSLDFSKPYGEEQKEMLEVMLEERERQQEYDAHEDFMQEEVSEQTLQILE